MKYTDLELEPDLEDKTSPFKVFIYKSFICYMTETTMPLDVRDPTTTTSGYIIVRHLNSNEYICMKEVIKKIKVGEKQKTLDGVENLTMNKIEITFSCYESFWASMYGGPWDTEYV